MPETQCLTPAHVLGMRSCHDKACIHCTGSFHQWLADLNKRNFTSRLSVLIRQMFGMRTQVRARHGNIGLGAEVFFRDVSDHVCMSRCACARVHTWLREALRAGGCSLPRPFAQL